MSDLDIGAVVTSSGAGEADSGWRGERTEDRSGRGGCGGRDRGRTRDRCRGKVSSGRLSGAVADFTVHTAHHYAFFPAWRYVTSGPGRRLTIRKRTPDVHVSNVRNARVRLAHFGWYMAIGATIIYIEANVA